MSDYQCSKTLFDINSNYCGYVFTDRIGSQFHVKPVNLPERFQQEGISVVVTYRKFWKRQQWCQKCGAMWTAEIIRVN